MHNINTAGKAGEPECVETIRTTTVRKMDGCIRSRSITVLRKNKEKHESKRSKVGEICEKKNYIKNTYCVGKSVDIYGIGEWVWMD